MPLKNAGEKRILPSARVCGQDQSTPALMPDPTSTEGAPSTPPKPALPNEFQVAMNFLKEYEKQIGTVAAVASTLGIILAAVGLFWTKAQIEDSRKALEATTVYNIQKDAREVLKDLNQTPDVYSYITEGKLPENPSPDFSTKAESKIAELIQFYSGVFNQHRNEVITGKYWDTFAEEICGFIQFPVVSEFWKKRAADGRYSKEFRQFGSKCLEQKKSSTP